MNLLVGSFCSGIAAPEVAWTGLGWVPVFFSEIDPFACALLAHRFPGVPNLGDMTKVDCDATIERCGPVDVVVAGTPCQSFSVAGLRKGMADPRGNLALVLLGLVDRIRPRWLVWENVPGVLSSGGGRDFGAFLGGLGQLGYGWAYRVLDAQHFGVPQRRRRVFVVGHLGDWRHAAAVLFERHCLCGHPPPSREAGQGVAASLTRGADGDNTGGYAGRRREDDTNLIAGCLNSGGNNGGFRTEPGEHLTPVAIHETCPAIKARDYKGPSSDGDGAILVPMVAHSLRADGFDASEDGTGGQVITFTQKQRNEIRTMDTAGACAAEPGMKQQTFVVIPAIAFQERGREGGRSIESQEDIAHSQNAPDGGGRRHEMNVVTPTMAVRRLTPLECERLQGLPDYWTLIPYNGKPAKDGPRYRAIGNSMAIPVLRWIGERIELVEQVISETGGREANP